MTNLFRPDPIAAHQINLLVQNAADTSIRKRNYANVLDERRDIDDECGYPGQNELQPEHYRRLYDREAVANRVVAVLPKETWKSHPHIFETEDKTNTTEFESDLKNLSTSLYGDSWFSSPRGNPIWEYLERADIQSGIGPYGVIFIGLDDGKGASEPVTPKSAKNVLFLRTFDASLVEISTYEMDINNPRHGHPTAYNLTLASPDNPVQEINSNNRTKMAVHWTRIIHLADNLGSSEVIGVPRIKPVYNRLYDLRKLYGGSAEMYWKGALPGFSWETHPQLGGDVAIDRSGMRDSIEQFRNGLQRDMVISGMHANSLAPQVVDPSPQIEVQLNAICIQLGIPKRKFTGSERGELASTQDEGDWNDTIRARQNGYVTPRIIVPFIDRLIWSGVLTAPLDGYSVQWPDLDALTAQQQADVALTVMDAAVKMVAGNVEQLITPMNFWTTLQGYDAEKAIQIVEDAKSHAATITKPMQEPEDPENRNQTIPKKADMVGQDVTGNSQRLIHETTDSATTGHGDDTTGTIESN